MRGRVVDWRGVGIENFRIIATNQRGPVESLTLGDGQYTFIGLSPGTYDVTVSDSRSEPAQSIPVQAARVTTLDWIETGRVESDPTPAQSSPTSLSIPTRTVTAVASNQSGRPPTPAARPLAPETVAIRLVLTTFEQFVGSVLTGFAAVGLTAVVVFIVLRWRANE